jgi:hypothetical protein
VNKIAAKRDMEPVSFLAFHSELVGLILAVHKNNPPEPADDKVTAFVEMESAIRAYEVN